MKAAELESFITEFLSLFRAAEKAYNDAKSDEENLNLATQDILHTIELRPNEIDANEVVRLLHDIRIQRRGTKNELEVQTEFFDWVSKNKPVMTSLEAKLGNIRKILRRQPSDQYRYKTNILQPKDSWITRYIEPTYEQLCLW